MARAIQLAQYSVDAMDAIHATICHQTSRADAPVCSTRQYARMQEPPCEL